MEPGPVSTVPTPASLVDVPRGDLLDALGEAEHALTNARYGIGHVHPPARLREFALVALAAARALADLLLRFEPWTQLDALRAGATLADVAAASGLTVDEVLAGLRSRLAGQVEHGLMGADVADELHALIDRAAAAEPPPPPA
jgi:broad specificity phosphatase PhoE